MKKKFSILLILVVAVLTLAVVGYSAWYITRSADPVTGNVQAYNVDAGEIDVKTCDSSGTIATQNIIFGRPSTYDNTDHWLQCSDSDGVENLTVYFYVEADGKGGTFNISATNVGQADSKLYSAPTFALVSGAGCSCTAAGVLTLADDTKAVISVTYTWGLGSNPFTYFTGTTKSAAVADDALTLAQTVLSNNSWTGNYGKFAEDYLTAVYALNSGTFTITVTDANAA